MAHLKQSELTQSYEALFCSLFGLENYQRWVGLKQILAVATECEFVSHILDATEQIYGHGYFTNVDQERDDFVLPENQASFMPNDDGVNEESDLYEVENLEINNISPQLLDIDIPKNDIVKDVEKQHTCPECGKNFRLKDGMIRHINIVHTAPQEFHCNFCLIVFSNRSERLEHEQTEHSEHVKSYECELCHKRFTMKHHVRRHEKAVHYNERNEMCIHCGMKFALSSHLNRHVQAVHLGIKRFLCDICHQKFTTKSAMQDHRLRKHVPAVVNS